MPFGTQNVQTYSRAASGSDAASLTNVRPTATRSRTAVATNAAEETRSATQTGRHGPSPPFTSQ